MPVLLLLPSALSTTDGSAASSSPCRDEDSLCGRSSDESSASSTCSSAVRSTHATNEGRTPCVLCVVCCVCRIFVPASPFVPTGRGSREGSGAGSPPCHSFDMYISAHVYGHRNRRLTP